MAVLSITLMLFITIKVTTETLKKISILIFRGSNILIEFMVLSLMVITINKIDLMNQVASVLK
jgi:hypothetical protein